MKRTAAMTFLLLLAAAGAASAQSMMSTSTGSTDASSMTSSATADPKVGAELRAARSTGKKVLFTDMAAAQALAAKGPVVLFFAADWCPNCQADLADINAMGTPAEPWWRSIGATCPLNEFDIARARAGA